ncbi:MAG: universal stress protein [Hyphomicrobiaceae bacterium]
MGHRILCAIDGTDHSHRALDMAAEMAAKLGAGLTICSVNVVMGSGRGPLISAKPDAEVEALLKTAAAAAEKAGVKDVKWSLLRSREAATGVVMYAEDGKYDIIVTGTGDKQGLSRLVLGSVAADIASRAHCSVMVAR